jgi:hypothetical protein
MNEAMKRYGNRSMAIKRQINHIKGFISTLNILDKEENGLIK